MPTNNPPLENAVLREANREQQLQIAGLKAANLSLEAVVAELRHVQRHIEVLNSDLNARNSALEALNHELESFSYAVSHDLRNPLRSVHGFSEALRKSAAEKLNDEEQTWLQRICDAAARMDQLIDDLLRLSRITRREMRFQQIDLTAMAQAIARELSESAPERNVRWEIASDLRASGDPVLIQVVLENLLGNAFKYTGRQAEARIQVGQEADGAPRAFFVRDNGAGFDMAYAKKLFAPFQRLHSIREFPGSGVGLACSARALHRHGGTISAEAKVGEGAIFYFTLPETSSEGRDGSEGNSRYDKQADSTGGGLAG